MQVGIPKETQPGETRVAATPDSVKKMVARGLQVLVEKGAGEKAFLMDEAFEKAGAAMVDRAQALGADVVLKVRRPSFEEVDAMKQGAALIAFLEPYLEDGLLEHLAGKGIAAFAMELIPRTSRAQPMDALSSQANIAGYRATLEAAVHYGRFFPMMMTAAGSAKPARVFVLGAGVAGLQVIATARRLGAAVEAYDVRPEVKEEVQSLGARFIELEVGESGAGAGGYAKELSEEAKRRQQEAMTAYLKRADVIISTALVPGRRAPVLITEEAVKGMHPGSVIVDMAAAQGGNCPLTEADRVIKRDGVTIIGLTNYPALVPTDASAFYARNLFNLLSLMIDEEGKLSIDLEDDILDRALVTHQGSIRYRT